MKKILVSAVLALAVCTSALADEGMWMLPLLQKMNSRAMENLGCHLSADDIYSINHSSLKDAIVHFGGGCTGEIISGEGLLTTNHHCGYSSIQALSTPEHNYLEDGFWAMSRAEELPAPGLSVTFMERMEDVSNQFKGVSEDEAVTLKADIIKKARENNPNCDATVVSFYNDNTYYLIIYKEYKDVRLVGTPPSSLGKFGGDTDNWMWPRHTCDFSMFRVYAGKDNEPAEYSEDNVPYRPKQYLNVSLKGYKDGDYAMVIGYPGSTQRFQTADQLKQMMEVNDIRIAARTVRQDIMWEARMADPVVNLQYANKYARSSNGWKKWQGMKQAFAKLDIIARQEQEEADFNKWVSAKKKRTEAYGNALATISEAVAETDDALKARTLLNETLFNIELATAPVRLFQAVAQCKKEGIDTNLVVARAIDMLDPMFKDYNEELDRKEAAAMIRFYRDNVKPGEEIEFPGADLATMDVKAYVDSLFDSSVYTSADKLRAAYSLPSELLTTPDPAQALYNAMYKKYSEFSKDVKASQKTLADGSRAYTAGQLEWKKNEPSYPDANSTMRLSYGSVKSYSPKDGVIYNYYTTLAGVMEKEDPDNYEFTVPEGLKTIFANKDFGRYANRNGEMPTCFLTTNDITGGNSGSPVLDANGSLIGLAFDGNWEAMSGDVMFEPTLQRCICVDIRYVLLVMDKFGGAGYLLKEMNLVK